MINLFNIIHFSSPNSFSTDTFVFMQIDKTLLSEQEGIKCTKLNLYAELGYLSQDCFNLCYLISAVRKTFWVSYVLDFGSKNKLTMRS